MRAPFTIVGASSRVDAVIDCDDATPVRTFAAALADVVGSSGELHTTAGVVADELTIEQLGLRAGDRLGVGLPVEPDIRPAGSGWQLHIVAGPDSGLVFALPVGDHEIGRTGSISVADNAMSRRHCRLSVSEHGLELTDLESSNGTRVGGRAVAPGVVSPLQLGEIFVVGHSAMAVRPARSSDAVIEGAEPGTAHFLRQPRLLAPQVVREIVVPTAPSERTSRKIPVIAMVIPLLLGVAMTVVIGNPLFLMFTVMSPVMLAANWWSDKRTGAKEYKDAVVKYHEDLERSQTRLIDAVHDEEQERRAAFPDAADTYLTCVLPGRRLWERRRHDTDALCVRVGTADLPAAVSVRDRDEEQELPRVQHVPVVVDLAAAGVVGAAGPAESVSAQLRWLVVQLATYQPTRDLLLTVVTGRAQQSWDWLRWLPHCRVDGDAGSGVLLGNDPDSVGAQLAVLLAVLTDRQRAVRENREIRADSFPAHIVVVHGYSAMRQTRGLTQILEDGPAVGIYAVVADDDERLLPEQCTVTVVWDPSRNDFATVRRTGEPDQVDVLTEGVATPWCTRVARALAPLVDVGVDNDGAMLPDSARLLEVVGMDPPDVDAVRARWALEPRSTKMTIGEGLDGDFALDLSKDGPHGLIAGMTGSGKTELLQTIIASLAIANRPDQMNFVLVDYKGDAAFSDCVDLPHTVGKVNDLDPHLVVRALESLQAELTVRKNMLAAAGVKDIEDYQRLQAREPQRAPMPRLLLVIDEFAQMIKDLPDFVKGLVGIAQVGRSLGVHLLLATQRPSGSVSPEIRANTNLRISLRVADAADSSDVLNSPEAAAIPKSSPGRGFARLGAGSLLSFQAGRVGGRRPGAAAPEVARPFVVPVPWQQLGRTVPFAPSASGSDDVADTDLHELVRVVRDASSAENIPAQRQPWLPALPTDLLVDDVFDGYAPDTAVPALPIGTCDVPREQKQVRADFDLVRDGHLLVVGAGGTGRSQVLRAIAASVARLASPHDIHLYGLDCGNGALNALTSLPHCGAVVGRTDVERAARLFARLNAELDRRQEVLGAGGYADITEQRRNSDSPLPHVVLMLDRWEGFAPVLGDFDNGSMTEGVGRVLREGASLGVHAVITGDRSLANTSKIASAVDNKLAFRLADKMDYSMVGLDSRDMPDHMPPGRAFSSSRRETQIMLLSADAGGQGQAAALTALGREAADRHGEVTGPTRPFRLDALPSRLSVDDALALVAESTTGPRIVVGVGGDDLTALGPDFARGTGFVVAGPSRSGRSSVLFTSALSALRTGAQVIVSAPRTSPLRQLAGVAGVLGVVTSTSAAVEEYEQMMSRATGPVLLVLDDVDVEKDLPAGEFFTRVVGGDTDRPVVTMAAADSGGNLFGGFGSWTSVLRNSRQGVLLSPQATTEAELLGLSLNQVNRQLFGGPVQPGKGLLHLGDGRLVRVVLPLPEQLPAAADGEPAIASLH